MMAARTFNGPGAQHSDFRIIDRFQAKQRLSGFCVLKDGK